MATDHEASFAGLLRRLRVASGLTQEELAHRAGLSVRAVSDLERGVRTKPRRYTVDALSAALELSPTDRAALHAAVPAGPAPSLTGDQSLSMLPREATPLLGREREEAEALHLVRWVGIRLLTLTGPGGVGKTRLATRLGSVLRDDFSDGVAFVSLAPLREADLVLSTIAATMGVRESGGRSLPDMLAAHLRDKDLLLILDNFETVLDAAPRVADLLAACPRLTVIVTSRAVLGVWQEHPLDVPPLATPGEHPPASRQLDPIRLRRYPAIALFVQRARAVDPEFVVTRSLAPMIADICRRLEGLPLAIELAAAQIKVLPPEAMLPQLDRRLGIPKISGASLPARQQTMRYTIAWSYNLLSESEQRLFRRVSIFSGGWDPDAGEAVCGPDAWEGLAALADKSLIVSRERDEELRFGMLETIREYGLERLEEGQETERIAGLHAVYYLELALTAEAMLYGSEQVEWLERLERDHDNFRATLRHFCASPQTSEASVRAVQLAGALGRFWWMRGHLTEGRQWLEEALRLHREGAPGVRAKALQYAGMLALSQGDYEHTVPLLEEALQLYRELDDARGAIRTVNLLAVAAQEQGDYERAVAMHEENLALERSSGELGLQASTLNNLGEALRRQGDFQHARAMLAESVALERELEDTRGLASSLHNLGDVLCLLGEEQRAGDVLAEALDNYRKVGEQRGIGRTLISLGLMAQQRGDLARARSLCGEALTRLQAVGDRISLAEALEALGAVAAGQHDARRAVQLFAAADALRRAIGAPVPPGEREGYDRVLTNLRGQVSEEAWESLWFEGQKLTTDQVMAHAIQGAEET